MKPQTETLLAHETRKQAWQIDVHESHLECLETIKVTIEEFRKMNRQDLVDKYEAILKCCETGQAVDHILYNK